MSSKLKCMGCSQRKSHANFTYLHEKPNAFQVGYLKRSPFCHDCQKKRVERPNHAIQPYINRNHILRRMGFDSYAEYLASDKWKAIRLRVLKKDGFKCRVCGCRATQVHHNIYGERELRGQSMKGMRSLCEEHHRQVEFDGSKKVGLVEASHRYAAMEHP